jgi:hypothetical protein
VVSVRCPPVCPSLSSSHVVSKSRAQVGMVVMNNFKKDEPNNQNHSNQVTISVPPYGGIRRIRPKPPQTMASDANSPWAHLVQDTAGMANQTTSTPFPSGIQVTLPNSRFICPQDHCKMEKTAPPVQITSLFTSVIHPRFGSDNSASTIQRQHQTIPHHQAIAFTSILAEIAQELTKIHPIKLEPSPTPPTIHLSHTLLVRKRLRRLYHPLTIPNDSSPPGYCLHFNSCGNCSRTHQDTSNQARALSHTTHNSPQSYIAGSEAITVPLPSTDNTK